MEWNPAFDNALRSLGFTAEQIQWTRAESQRRFVPPLQILLEIGRISPQQASVLAALPDPRFADAATFAQLVPQRPATSFQGFGANPLGPPLLSQTQSTLAAPSSPYASSPAPQGPPSPRRISTEQRSTLGSSEMPSKMAQSRAIEAVFEAERYDRIKAIASGRELVLDRRLQRRVERISSPNQSPFEFLERPRWISRFDHQGLPRIHDISEGPPAFYTLDPAPGPSLTQAIRDNNAQVSQDIPSLTSFFLGLASALDHAHKSGLIHGSLRSDVIFVGSFGALRIDGWEQALLAHESDSQATQAQALKAISLIDGVNLAPELSEDAPIRALSDIWALGAIAFQTITGRRATLDDPYVKWWSQTRADLQPPPELRAIIEKALHTAPEERYQSAEDLASDLRRCLDGRAPEASQDSFYLALLRWRRQNSLAAFFVIVAALIAGAAGIYASLTVAGAAARAREARAEANRLDETVRVQEALNNRELADLRAQEGSAGVELEMASALAEIGTLSRLDASESHDERILATYEKVLSRARSQSTRPTATLRLGMLSRARWRLERSFRRDAEAARADLTELIASANSNSLNSIELGIQSEARYLLFLAERQSLSGEPEIESLLAEAHDSRETLKSHSQAVPLTTELLVWERRVRGYEAENERIRDLPLSQKARAQREIQQLYDQSKTDNQELQAFANSHSHAHAQELAGRLQIARDGFGLLPGGVVPELHTRFGARSKQPVVRFLRASILSPSRKGLLGLSLSYVNSRFGLYPTWHRDNRVCLGLIFGEASHLRPSTELARLIHTLTMLGGEALILQLLQQRNEELRLDPSRRSSVELELQLLILRAKVLCGQKPSLLALERGLPESLACEALLLRALDAARERQRPRAEALLQEAYPLYSKAAFHSAQRLQSMIGLLLTHPQINPQDRYELARRFLATAKLVDPQFEIFTLTALNAGADAGFSGGGDPRAFLEPLFKALQSPAPANSTMDILKRQFLSSESETSTFRLNQARLLSLSAQRARATPELLALASGVNLMNFHSERLNIAAFQALLQQLQHHPDPRAFRALRELDPISEVWVPRVGSHPLMSVWSDRQRGILSRRAQ